MKPLLTILLCALLFIDCPAQKIYPQFNWYDKPDTKNDSTNLRKLKIKSITISEFRFGDRYSSYLGGWKREFDSLGNIVQDSQDLMGAPWKSKLKHDKYGNPQELEVWQDKTNLHNVCHYKYDSKGNITQMHVKVLGNSNENTVKKAELDYDESNLLKSVDYDRTDRSMDYIYLQYKYEFYK